MKKMLTGILVAALLVLPAIAFSGTETGNGHDAPGSSGTSGYHGELSGGETGNGHTPGDTGTSGCNAERCGGTVGG